MRSWIAGGLVLGLCFLWAVDLPAADLVTLTPETWQEFSPEGKEVDCIYGDLVLRNDKLIAVIANPIAGRNANMTVKDVAGCIIDLSVLPQQSDQLSAYYPGGKQMDWRMGKKVSDVRDATTVQVTLRAEPAAEWPAAELTYTLMQGSPYILVETTYVNQGAKTLEFPLVVDVLADTTFDKSSGDESSLFWVYDPWFGQAYGVVAQDATLKSSSAGNASTVRFPRKGSTVVTLAAGEKVKLARYVFPGKNLLDIRATANDLTGVQQQDYALLGARHHRRWRRRRRGADPA